MHQYSDWFTDFSSNFRDVSAYLCSEGLSSVAQFLTLQYHPDVDDRFFVCTILIRYPEFPNVSIGTFVGLAHSKDRAFQKAFFNELKWLASLSYEPRSSSS